MSESSGDQIDWDVTTFAGNRRRQQQEFRALSFREKLTVLEDFGRIDAFFASRRCRAPDQPEQTLERHLGGTDDA